MSSNQASAQYSDESCNILLDPSSGRKQDSIVTRGDKEVSKSSALSYLELLTLQYVTAANERDWTNPILTNFLAPNIHSIIEVSNTEARGIAEHTQLIKSTVGTGDYHVEPTSAVAQFQDPEFLYDRRRQAKETAYAAVWVLFNVTYAPSGIKRESVGLFEYRQRKGGKWMMTHYRALNCVSPLPESCPFDLKEAGDGT